MSQREAAETTVAALRAADAVGVNDEALVAAFLGLASAVDEAAEDSPSLWREYRALIEAVRGLGAGRSDDDTKEFLVSVRTPMVNSEDS